MPRDPEGTYRAVSGGTLRVGVIGSGVWIRLEDGEARGVEPVLVRRLAEELEAEVEWVRGPADELLEALHRYELDLVIGGLTHSTPWRGRVALTAPFLTVPVEVGTPPGVEAIESLEGRRVAVTEGSPWGAMIEGRGGIAVRMPVRRLAGYEGLVAAPAWRLEAWGRVPSGITLTRHRHVWAAAPGENRWLVHLERFLAGRRGEARGLLQRAAEVEASAG